MERKPQPDLVSLPFPPSLPICSPFSAVRKCLSLNPIYALYTHALIYTTPRSTDLDLLLIVRRAALWRQWPQQQHHHRHHHERRGALARRDRRIKTELSETNQYNVGLYDHSSQMDILCLLADALVGTIW